ncbi:hypothetical protein J6590_038862 [Homalodisca vitripennis]|nr:hypothetical protein J6590_038862 [Homalodisca vitripennis]
MTDAAVAHRTCSPAVLWEFPERCENPATYSATEPPSCGRHSRVTPRDNRTRRSRTSHSHFPDAAFIHWSAVSNFTAVLFVAVQTGWRVATARLAIMKIFMAITTKELPSILICGVRPVAQNDGRDDGRSDAVLTAKALEPTKTSGVGRFDVIIPLIPDK